jgi:hypothetical protein
VRLTRSPSFDRRRPTHEVVFLSSRHTVHLTQCQIAAKKLIELSAINPKGMFGKEGGQARKRKALTRAPAFEPPLALRTIGTTSQTLEPVYHQNAQDAGHRQIQWNCLP